VEKYVDNNKQMGITYMKIAVLTPKAEFATPLQQRLKNLGEIIYTDSRRPYSLAELVKLTKDVDILAIDPDNLGGFELAPNILPKLLDQASSIKSLALSTTSYGYIDEQYCQSRGIKVSNVPHYSSESVAEHAITLLLGCSKRIFVSDRQTQQGKYQLNMGQEISGKTLGIIGLGDIGSQTAKLAKGLGMKVIGWNRTPKKVRGVRNATLDELLSQSDYISIHLRDCEQTRGILSEEKISKLKRGVIIVNTASRELVDEQVLAKALKSGLVDSYTLEAEDLKSGPLGKLKNAFLFKGFGWYTKEALERNKEIWVNNIVSHSKDNLTNRVY
jgi:phosphoglycerate dehydrogenase-like enzyme